MTKNVHIQLSFKDSLNLLWMIDKFETCRSYRATIALSFLQILDLYIVPYRFYESLKEEIRCVKYARFPTSYISTTTNVRTKLLCDFMSGQCLENVCLSDTIFSSDRNNRNWPCCVTKC